MLCFVLFYHPWTLTLQYYAAYALSDGSGEPTLTHSISNTPLTICSEFIGRNPHVVPLSTLDLDL